MKEETALTGIYGSLIMAHIKEETANTDLWIIMAAAWTILYVCAMIKNNRI